MQRVGACGSCKQFARSPSSGGHLCYAHVEPWVGVTCSYFLSGVFHKDIPNDYVEVNGRQSDEQNS